MSKHLHYCAYLKYGNTSIGRLVEADVATNRLLRTEQDPEYMNLLEEVNYDD